ncbi:glycosyltransferase family 2 protein, partial [Candidatus Woesearchaeota archaeon]|nr:glycosyltransferase family 2 protein [Candidatus Woesearchaeota archaeon]
MDLSIIIVSYNTADLIGACLQSLESAFSGKREITVVDNASTDGSSDFIKDNFPFINLIQNPVNRGFATANNQGLSQCRGKYIFFLNPDTVVMPGAMDEAASYMDENLNIGLAGVRIVNPDGTRQESVSYRYPSETYTRGEVKELKGSIACVLGAAMIARRECLKIVGGFDEDFFLYGEDQDLCLRIRKTGYEIGYTDDSVIIHISGQSERQTPPAALWRKKTRAEHLFYRKHTRFRLAMLRLTMPLSMNNGKNIEKLVKYRVISEAIRTEQQASEGGKKPAFQAAGETEYCPAESYTGEMGNVLEHSRQGVTGKKNGSSATLKPKISVILTAWQRPQYLEEQVERILSQTVVPCEIVLWYNKPSKGKGSTDYRQLLHFKNDHRVKKIICDCNFGIIPRFALASCMEGDYVCIFDDDTMPGTRWLENCLNVVDTKQALCGTIGIRYLSKTELKTQKPRMGWEGMNDR